MRKDGWVAALLVGFLVTGCCKTKSGDDSEDPWGATTAPAKDPIGAPTTAAPTASATATSPNYNKSSIKTVADSCTDAKVVLAVIPASIYNKPDFEWRWARQVVIANPQFSVVPQAAILPGHVVFHTYNYGTKPDKALVAHCIGKTCNNLAAAYKTGVPSSRPRVYCGKVPGIKRIAGGDEVISEYGNPRAHLPAKNDVISQCARLAACRLRSDPTITDDPGLACQRAPSKFKTRCAFKYPCSAVLACLGN